MTGMYERGESIPVGVLLIEGAYAVSFGAFVAAIATLRLRLRGNPRIWARAVAFGLGSPR
jgi:hypothetical protein